MLSTDVTERRGEGKEKREGLLLGKGKEGERGTGEDARFLFLFTTELEKETGGKKGGGGGKKGEGTFRQLTLLADGRRKVKRKEERGRAVLISTLLRRKKKGRVLGEGGGRRA